MTVSRPAPGVPPDMGSNSRPSVSQALYGSLPTKSRIEAAPAPIETERGAVTVQLERVPARLSVDVLAASVASLSSDDQADFLVRLVGFMKSFPDGGVWMQALSIGDDLAKDKGCADVIELFSYILERAGAGLVKGLMEE